MTARSASRHRRRLLAGLVVVAVLVVSDQLSKAATGAWLDPAPPGLERDVHGHRRYPLLGEAVALTSSCNRGAAFGQLDQFPLLLVLGRIFAVGMIAWLLLRSSPGSRAVTAAMVLVLAGAIGNLADNLWSGCVPAGYGDVYPLGVRDFLDVWFEPLLGWDYHFPAFNLADACITVGACLWIVSGFFQGSADPRQAPAAQAPGGREGGR